MSEPTNEKKSVSPLTPLFGYFGDYFSLNSYDMFVIKYVLEKAENYNHLFKYTRINKKEYLDIDKHEPTAGMDFYRDLKIKIKDSEDSISKFEYLPIRHTSIKIPQHKWDTETINFINKKIVKPVPVIGTTKKLKFSIIPDDNLSIINYYQKSGFNDYMDMDMADNMKIKNYFLLEDFGKSSFTKYAIIVNNSCLDYRTLIQNGYNLEGWTSLSDTLGKRVFQEHPPYWIFEDVKFLGSTSPLSLNQNGSGSLTKMEIEFIYNRCNYYNGE